MSRDAAWSERTWDMPALLSKARQRGPTAVIAFTVLTLAAWFWPYQPVESLSFTYHMAAPSSAPDDLFVQSDRARDFSRELIRSLTEAGEAGIEARENLAAAMHATDTATLEDALARALYLEALLGSIAPLYPGTRLGYVSGDAPGFTVTLHLPTTSRETLGLALGQALAHSLDRYSADAAGTAKAHTSFRLDVHRRDLELLRQRRAPLLAAMQRHLASLDVRFTRLEAEVPGLTLPRPAQAWRDIEHTPNLLEIKADLASVDPTDAGGPLAQHPHRDKLAKDVARLAADHYTFLLEYALPVRELIATRLRLEEAVREAIDAPSPRLELTRKEGKPDFYIHTSKSFPRIYFRTIGILLAAILTLALLMAIEVLISCLRSPSALPPGTAAIAAITFSAGLGTILVPKLSNDAQNTSAAYFEQSIPLENDRIPHDMLLDALTLRMNGENGAELVAEAAVRQLNLTGDLALVEALGGGDVKRASSLLAKALRGQHSNDLDLAITITPSRLLHISVTSSKEVDLDPLVSALGTGLAALGWDMMDDLLTHERSRLDHVPTRIRLLSSRLRPPALERLFYDGIRLAWSRHQLRQSFDEDPRGTPLRVNHFLNILGAAPDWMSRKAQIELRAAGDNDLARAFEAEIFSGTFPAARTALIFDKLATFQHARAKIAAQHANTLLAVQEVTSITDQQPMSAARLRQVPFVVNPQSVRFVSKTPSSKRSALYSAFCGAIFGVGAVAARATARGLKGSRRANV